MLVHAAFGGSTNLLLHIPAIAHAAGLPSPTVADWTRVNRSAPRLVDALPNGPRNHPTVQVFLAGGVPEVMLQLRARGLLDCTALTVTGANLGELLDWWQTSERRASLRQQLREHDGIDPDDVILSPASARQPRHDQHCRFSRRQPRSRRLGRQGHRHRPGTCRRGRGLSSPLARRGSSPPSAQPSPAIKGQGERTVQAGDVLVVIGVGPQGTGMEETYQLTSALKFLPWGKQVPLLTDARFSGVSTGACIGHIGPEALAGGPLGKLRDGDLISIRIDRVALAGSVDLVGTADGPLDQQGAAALLNERAPHPGLAPHPQLPADTRLWAALQSVSGGTWAGCIYDSERILTVLEAGQKALAAQHSGESEKEQA